MPSTVGSLVQTIEDMHKDKVAGCSYCLSSDLGMHLASLQCNVCNMLYDKKPCACWRQVFQLAKGFRGRSKNCIRIARERVEKALQYAWRDRRTKKREMRSLWIQRINAASKEHGVSIIRLFN